MSYEDNECYEELTEADLAVNDDAEDEEATAVGDERYMEVTKDGDLVYKKMGLVKIGARKAKVKYEKARDFYNAVIEEIERELGSATPEHPNVSVRLAPGLKVMSSYVPEKTMYSTLFKRDVYCRPHVRMRVKFDTKCKDRINKYGGYRE